MNFLEDFQLHKILYNIYVEVDLLIVYNLG